MPDTELNDPNRPPAWITIGTFDGVHLGHQAIIRKLVHGAHMRNERAVVVTFYPHPAEILRNITGPYYLTTPDERETLLKKLNVDEVITYAFNRGMAEESAHNFILNLRQKVNFSCLLVGYDFRLGSGRAGDITTLRELGREFNFEVETISPQSVNGYVISSSAIRQLITNAEMRKTVEMLGRWFSVTGEVVHGDGRGVHIGIPTANVAIWPRLLLPPSGVYAATVELENKSFQAVLNIGQRPTFYIPPAEMTFEVHILDFDQVLYGKVIKVNLIEFLRPETRFRSAEALMEQIKTDIQQTREVLTHAPQTPGLSS
jgi:riboflavin kinase/FMN adenylyltransferase